MAEAKSREDHDIVVATTRFDSTTRTIIDAGDPATIAGYIGKSDAFADAIERFALAYADQNEADWSAFKTAVKTGRLQAMKA